MAHLLTPREEGLSPIAHEHHPPIDSPDTITNGRTPLDYHSRTPHGERGRVMAANHYPDVLTIKVITALQQEVDDELRQEGSPSKPTSKESSRAQRFPTGPRRNRRPSHHTDDDPTPRTHANESTFTQGRQPRTPRKHCAQRPAA
ncbi:hypothetical protein AOZ06_08515 [Kibdelosporangium phytohabitans]|uniref:Uncharacterized protein n=2 Tax=Kibdelosporangium phytohabitans TaxID=860235 RepID=A0A0N9HYK4_9PSEU|nr:hypothetical protein AOZ06_08515 [Kibdelosporangium phytohabitans]